MPQLNGQLAESANGVIADIPDGVSRWTQGGTSLTVLQARPTITRPWTINAWAIQVYADMIPFGDAPPNGLLGKVMGAILLGGTVTRTSPINVTPFQPPPAEALSTLTTLWDGSQDAPLPLHSGSGPGPMSRLLFTSQQLPQPRQLDPSDQIGIGLWLTPSLLNHMYGIFLYSGTFTIDYDGG